VHSIASRTRVPLDALVSFRVYVADETQRKPMFPVEESGVTALRAETR